MGMLHLLQLFNILNHPMELPLVSYSGRGGMVAFKLAYLMREHLKICPVMVKIMELAVELEQLQVQIFLPAMESFRLPVLSGLAGEAMVTRLLTLLLG